jgi:hypothetical protein
VGFGSWADADRGAMAAMQTRSIVPSHPSHLALPASMRRPCRVLSPSLGGIDAPKPYLGGQCSRMPGDVKNWILSAHDAGKIMPSSCRARSEKSHRKFHRIAGHGGDAPPGKKAHWMRGEQRVSQQERVFGLCLGHQSEVWSNRFP